jgi:hypothetical protein
VSFDPTLIADLVRSGTDPDLIARVAAALTAFPVCSAIAPVSEREQATDDDRQKVRREAAAKRQARCRERRREAERGALTALLLRDAERDVTRDKALLLRDVTPPEASRARAFSVVEEEDNYPPGASHLPTPTKELSVTSVTIPDNSVDLFGDKLKSKALIRAEGNQALLDRITGLWNAWAVQHGSPQVQGLTKARGVHCRRRIADLMEFGPKTPEEAFKFLLTKCDQSFFAHGASRAPLKFNQLMREDFMIEMIEDGFIYRKPNGEKKWSNGKI